MSNLQVATAVEDLLRVIDNLPGIQLLTVIDSRHDYPFACSDEGQYSELLQSQGKITIQFNLSS